MHTQRDGHYWLRDMGYSVYYVGPHGCQHHLGSEGPWTDIADDATPAVLDGDSPERWTGPCASPPKGVSLAPLDGAEVPTYCVTLEGTTYEWNARMTLSTPMKINGRETSVEEWMASKNGVIFDELDALERAARMVALAEGTTTFTRLAEFGTTFAERTRHSTVWWNGSLITLPPFGNTAGDRQSKQTMRAFIETLQEAMIYPMLSDEYHAALRRALQLLNQVTATETDQRALEFVDHCIHSLEYSLNIDWSQVRVVEVRYKDGSTETLNLADDPGSKEKLRRAHAMFFPDE